MSTITQTYTQTDIRKVFENFQSDLQMLALRTQAMELDHAQNCAEDVVLMAQEGCLNFVHIHLYDAYQQRIRVHRYSVEENTSSDPQRPGGNKWPCLPGGSLCVIVQYSDAQQVEKLKNSGRLKLNWTDSSLSINYSGMQNDGERLYTSNSYGLRRDTFVN